MPKVTYKERILKAARKMQLVTYKEAPIRLADDFSKETMQDRKTWHKIFDVMKTQDLQPGILYPTELPFSQRTDQELPRQKQAKGIYHHQASITRNVGGTSLRRKNMYQKQE